MKRLVERIGRDRKTDLEAWETALREAVLRAGAKVLTRLLTEVGSGRRDEPILCGCGQRMVSHGLRSKEMLTILGEVTFERSMFRCPDCGATRYPGDEELDVVATTRSPGLRRMMARAGGRSTFKEGSEDLRIFAGIRVSTKDVERVAEGIGEDIEDWRRGESKLLIAQASLPHLGPKIPVLYVSCDGTGVPMVPAAVQGRRGKQPDGSARTREVKLGCVFTQTTTDGRGRPVREPASTTFVGAIEAAEEFGWRLYAEAVRRGLGRAQRVIVLGDGALWIRNLTEIHFPNALQIVDLYHAREHVSDLCKLLFTGDDVRIGRYRRQWWRALDRGRIKTIVRQARKQLPEDEATRKLVETELAYLEVNQSRMRYAAFRAAGLFIGSGVIEAGCKTIIGQRLKQSGMEWSLRGANAIIALRCNLRSGRFEDYWEGRAA